MQRKKATIIIISLFCVGFLLNVFLPDRNETRLEAVKAVSTPNHGQIEYTEDTAEVKKEEPIEQEPKKQNNKNDKPITEEMKVKVREVVEVALDLFNKDLKVVAIGDSLTEGIGDETESGGYVGILNHTFEDHDLNITVKNFGKKGNRSDQLLKRLEKDEIASAIEEADIVLITIGANDIMKVLKNNFMNVTMEPFQKEKVEYKKRLTAIINKINELNPDTHIYLIGFYNPFERYFADIKELEIIIDNWNDVGKSLTEVYDNVTYIPTKDLFSNATIDLLSEDQFHPNTMGYKLMAQRVLEYLKEQMLK